MSQDDSQKISKEESLRRVRAARDALLKKEGLGFLSKLTDEQLHSLRADTARPCKVCGISLPEICHADLETNVGKQEMCPFCALQMRNQLAGLPDDEPFGGQMAIVLFGVAVGHCEHTKQPMPTWVPRVVERLRRNG